MSARCCPRAALRQRQCRRLRARGAALGILLLTSGALLGACKQRPTEGRENGQQALSGSEAPSSADVKAAEGVAPDSVLVYYFHGNRRCRTCNGIQAAITKTIEERFASETASGLLQFREVNIDEPENAHFAQEFDLSFSSMVVTARQGDKTVKWHNCEQVWPLAHEEAKLSAYAEQQIRSYLELVRRS